jgi:hypothetical protein
MDFRPITADLLAVVILRWKRGNDSQRCQQRQSGHTRCASRRDQLDRRWRPDRQQWKQR